MYASLPRMYLQSACFVGAIENFMLTRCCCCWSHVAARSYKLLFFNAKRTNELCACERGTIAYTFWFLRKAARIRRGWNLFQLQCCCKIIVFCMEPFYETNGIVVRKCCGCNWALKRIQTVASTDHFFCCILLELLKSISFVDLSGTIWPSNLLSCIYIHKTNKTTGRLYKIYTMTNSLWLRLLIKVWHFFHGCLDAIGDFYQRLLYFLYFFSFL